VAAGSKVDVLYSTFEDDVAVGGAGGVGGTGGEGGGGACSGPWCSGAGGTNGCVTGNGPGGSGAGGGKGGAGGAGGVAEGGAIYNAGTLTLVGDTFSQDGVEGGKGGNAGSGGDGGSGYPGGPNTAGTSFAGGNAGPSGTPGAAGDGGLGAGGAVYNEGTLAVSEDAFLQDGAEGGAGGAAKNGSVCSLWCGRGGSGGHGGGGCLIVNVSSGTGGNGAAGTDGAASQHAGTGGDALGGALYSTGRLELLGATFGEDRTLGGHGGLGGNGGNGGAGGGGGVWGQAYDSNGNPLPGGPGQNAPGGNGGNGSNGGNGGKGAGGAVFSTATAVSVAVTYESNSAASGGGAAGGTGGTGGSGGCVDGSCAANGSSGAAGVAGTSPAPGPPNAAAVTIGRRSSADVAVGAQTPRSTTTACPAGGEGGPFLRMCSKQVFGGAQTVVGAVAEVTLPCSTTDFKHRVFVPKGDTYDAGYVYFAVYAPGVKSDELEVGFFHNHNLAAPNDYSLYVRHDGIWNEPPAHAVACNASYYMSVVFVYGSSGPPVVQVAYQPVVTPLLSSVVDGYDYTFDVTTLGGLLVPTENSLGGNGLSDNGAAVGKGGIGEPDSADWTSHCSACAVAMITAIAQNGPNNTVPKIPLQDGSSFGPVTWHDASLLDGANALEWDSAEMQTILSWKKGVSTEPYTGAAPNYTVTKVDEPCKTPPSPLVDRWTC